jgi:hypothetical protein
MQKFRCLHSRGLKLSIFVKHKIKIHILNIIHGLCVAGLWGIIKLKWEK